MTKKINWGILGYARIARNSAIPAILEAPSAGLYAIATRNEKTREEIEKQHPGVLAYGSYEALLEDSSVDAVYIPLPNALHKEWVLKALKKGKHVLCEKPLALNAGEVEEMVEASRTHQVLLMEAFMYRYTPRMKKVEEILSSGVLGEIRHLESSFRFFLNRPNTIKMKKELGGGALYDVGCYPVSFASFVMKKEPVKVNVSAQMDNGVDVKTSMLLTYEGGVTASLHCGFNAFGVNHSEVVGTLGRLVIPDTFLEEEGILTLYTDSGREEIKVSGCHRYTLEFEDFSRAVLNETAPYLSKEESLLQAKVMDQVLQEIYGAQ